MYAPLKHVNTSNKATIFGKSQLRTSCLLKSSCMQWVHSGHLCIYQWLRLPWEHHTRLDEMEGNVDINIISTIRLDILMCINGIHNHMMSIAPKAFLRSLIFVENFKRFLGVALGKNQFFVFWAPEQQVWHIRTIILTSTLIWDLKSMGLGWWELWVTADLWVLFCNFPPTHLVDQKRHGIYGVMGFRHSYVSVDWNTSTATIEVTNAGVILFCGGGRAAREWSEVRRLKER